MRILWAVSRCESRSICSSVDTLLAEAKRWIKLGWNRDMGHCGAGCRQTADSLRSIVNVGFGWTRLSETWVLNCYVTEQLSPKGKQQVFAIKWQLIAIFFLHVHCLFVSFGAFFLISILTERVNWIRLQGLIATWWKVHLFCSCPLSWLHEITANHTDHASFCKVWLSLPLYIQIGFGRITKIEFTTQKRWYICTRNDFFM